MYFSKDLRKSLPQTMTLAISSLSLLMSLLIYVGCNYQVKKTSDDGAHVPKLEAKDVPSFNEIQSSILESKCHRCHDADDAVAKFDTRKYSSVSTKALAIRNRIQSTGRLRMPPSGEPQLTENEFNLLMNWLDWGAQQEKPRVGDPKPTPPPPTTPPPSLPTPTATPLPRVGDLPSFEQLKSYVLNDKCLTCHNESSRYVDLHTYPLFFEKAPAIRARVVLSNESRGHMPPSRQPQLTDNELMTLLTWFDSGAPELGQGSWQPPETRVPTPAPTPAPTPVPSGTLPSFAQIKALVLDQKCLQCHDGADEFSVDLRTYPLFRARLETIRRRVVSPITEPGHMPKARKPQLTEFELATLISWIDDGAPEMGKGTWQPPQ